MVASTWRKQSLPNLTIQAVAVTEDNASKVAAWCKGVLIEEIDPFDKDKRTPGINVPTEQGNERASLGDYIFKIATGDFRVRKPGAFKSIWEPADALSV